MILFGTGQRRWSAAGSGVFEKETPLARPQRIAALKVLEGGKFRQCVESLNGKRGAQEIWLVGKLAVDAIFARDYPVIQGVMIISVVLVVLLNLMTDLFYTAADPRVRA